MYPVILQRIGDLRVGDRLIAHGGQRYPHPLRVLGPQRGPHGSGVRVEVEHPNPGEPDELVLHEWNTDGQVLEVERPAWQSPTSSRSWS